MFNSLIASGLLLSAANILAGCLGYVYQILMGRMLQPEGYASFISIIALTVFFGAPLGALVMVISRQVSALRAHDHLSELFLQYKKLLRQLFFVCLAFVLLLYPAYILVSYFRAGIDVRSIYLLGAIVIIGSYVMLNNAFLQGLQRFSWFASLGVMAVALKIIFSVVFIYLGLAVEGALLGVLVPAVLIFIIGYKIVLGSILNNGPQKTTLQVDNFLKFSSYFPVLVANLAFVAMTQLDIVLVSWYFPSEIAGQYAAAAILGKAILYLPGGLALALYPRVAENHASNIGSAKILLQTLAVASVVCIFAAAFYGIFGPQIINIFYGSSYEGAGQILRWYGFAIYPLTLVMVLENFLIAKERVIFAWVFLAVAPFQVLAIYLWHEDINSILIILGASGVLLLISGFVILWNDFKESIKGGAS
jgi:O-antigen/teichoic acid export membrane protein